MLPTVSGDWAYKVLGKIMYVGQSYSFWKWLPYADGKAATVGGLSFSTVGSCIGYATLVHIPD
jgi:hypothetical protein